MKIINQFLTITVNHPYYIILEIVFLTVLAAFQLPKLRIETDLRAMIPHDDVYILDEQIRNSFDLKDVLLIGVVNESGVLNIDTLQFAQELAGKIENIDGVYTVRSIFTEDNIRNTLKGLLIEPFIEDITHRGIKILTEGIKTFPAVQGILVSKDLTCISLLVEIEENADKSGIYFKIKKILKELPSKHDEKTYLSGMPVFEGVLGEYTFKDLITLMPILGFVLLTVLYFSYKSPLLVLLSLTEIIVVNIWTLGFMAYCGVPLYIILAVMPVILMSLVVADEIHLFSRYFEENQIAAEAPNNVKERILNAMTEMWTPVTLTSITTACGFISFIVSSMKPIKYFGLFTAIGVMGAWLFSLSMTPACLAIFKNKVSYKRPKYSPARPLSALGSYIHRNDKKLFWTLIMIVCFSVYGIFQVFVQDSWINNFKKESAVQIANEVLKNKLLGTRILHVELDTKKRDGIKNPLFLKALEATQKEIDQIDGIGGSISAVQPIAKFHKEFNDTYTIPDSYEAIGTILFLLESSSHNTFWDSYYQKARLTIFSKKGDYRSGRTIMAEVERALERNLEGVDIKFGGEYMLSYHWVDLLASDQVKSLILCLLLVFTVSSAFFKSLRKGLVVTIPIGMAVAFIFSFMGYAGIPLSVSVSIFSAIILGVGIDYVIHLQSKYELCQAYRGDEVLRNVFSSTGEAIFWNAIVVMAGFTVLLFSTQPTNHMLGLIVTMGILTSLISSFFIMPLLWQKIKSL